MTKKQEHQAIKTLVEDNVNVMFVDAHKIIGTVSGDITPTQVVQLHNIKRMLTDLIYEQVQQNKKPWKQY